MLHKLCISLAAACLIFTMGGCAMPKQSEPPATAELSSSAPLSSEAAASEESSVSHGVELPPSQPQDGLSEEPSAKSEYSPAEKIEEIPMNTQNRSMTIQVGDTTLTATLVDNSSADALLEKLAEGSITIDLHDYGNMEKVADLGFQLPQNDEQIQTQSGDLMLYQGSEFVIYYAPNAWSLTPLGRVDDVSPEELRKILGDGNVTVTLSLP